jgi:hypothetical protein
MKSLKNILYLLMAVTMSLAVISCSSDDDSSDPSETPSGSGKITLHFDNQYDPMNGEDLELGKKYVTSNGDTIMISQLRYWISNVKFYNGSTLLHEDPDSYYLIENTADLTREMIDFTVPAGEVTRLEFGIGVDAALNDTLGNNIGELDLANGMFWAWKTGYRFVRLDGMYYEPDSSNYQPLRIHSGLNPYYIEKSMDLPATIKVENGKENMVHFMVKINEIINGGANVIDVKEKDGIWMFFSEEDAWNRMNANIDGMFMIHHAE